MNSSTNVTSQSTDDGLVSYGYKLASRFLGVSSRVVGRLRKYDSVANWRQPTPAMDPVSLRTQHPSDPYPPSHHYAEATHVLGPWGFVTSRYFVGQFIMVEYTPFLYLSSISHLWQAFVLNRIQNIVVPPRNPLTLHHRMHRLVRQQPGRAAGLSYVLAYLFPIDLSSAFSRFVFRIPSVCLLSKTLFLWGVILLQTLHRFPTWQWDWLQTIENWTKQKSMDDICWVTFVSVCTTLFISALTSGMEGQNGSNNAPFNLFAYSFILYLYTSPAMQVESSQNGPLRPDRHATITIMLPLLQLALTHCMEIRPKWAKLRLVPTTIVGVLSLVHFHAVFWFYPTSYPIPNYVPNLVESVLLCITLFTLSLNAFTQLCLTGGISKPLLGHTASLMPKWDEDFTMVLFRLGTASLEATSVAGLGNEVGGVAVTSTLPSGARPGIDLGQGTVELSHSGVTSISPGQLTPHRGTTRGFLNEITRVKVNSTRTHFLTDTFINGAWRRGFLDFTKALWNVLKGIWRFSTSRRPTQSNSPSVVEDDMEEFDQDGIYERFLRGESVSDDEDEVFVPGQDPISDDGGDDTEDEEEQEISRLYTDLSEVASTSSAAPVLLAHMMNASTSPLTRRRYTSLLSNHAAANNPGEEENWDTYVQARRDSKQTRTGSDGENADGSNIRSCVICTVEPRDIICWPCR
ncbi:hypothetical protein QCA50_003693 [Cerrena zonata]|uniref:Uncharacterized protein n=1 Tax=Cerrena zonata TaxID=2478898 RepID=A0AAW0GN80_9APHY